MPPGLRRRFAAVGLRRRFAAVLGLTACLALVVPQAAQAGNVYSRVLRAYQTHGSIPTCEFTSAQLEAALKGIDTYGAQYFADFATAIQTALTQRAGGGCSPTAARLLGRIGTDRVKSRRGLRPAPVTAATSAPLPLPLLLMLILAIAGLLAAATAALWWASGWQPSWTLAWRHAWAEAGHRAGGLWLDFEDWARWGDR